MHGCVRQVSADRHDAALANCHVFLRGVAAAAVINLGFANQQVCMVRGIHTAFKGGRVNSKQGKSPKKDKAFTHSSIIALRSSTGCIANYHARPDSPDLITGQALSQT